MIIWSGFGFLALLIPIVTCLLVTGPVAAIFPSGYLANHNWPAALGVLAGAVVVWILGLRLHANQRVLVDPQTGQPVTLRRTHSLFFIPMQYWGIVAAVIAVFILFARSGTTQ